MNVCHELLLNVVYVIYNWTSLTNKQYHVELNNNNLFLDCYCDIYIYILISIDKQIKIQHLQLINWLHGFFDLFTNFAECFFFYFFHR
jgi:hypothetical protein